MNIELTEELIKKGIRESRVSTTTQQAMDNSSTQQLSQYTKQLKRIDDGITTAITASESESNAPYHLPAPAKFLRKATCREKAASVDKTNATNTNFIEQQKSIYTSHRKYVHSLMTQAPQGSASHAGICSRRIGWRRNCAAGCLSAVPRCRSPSPDLRAAC